MLLLELILLLLLCSVALGWVARHFKFPYPIALVVGGALLGFIPRLPQIPFDPQTILILVLPPILYQAALLTSCRGGTMSECRILEAFAPASTRAVGE